MISPSLDQFNDYLYISGEPAPSYRQAYVLCESSSCPCIPLIKQKCLEIPPTTLKDAKAYIQVAFQDIFSLFPTAFVYGL